MTFKVSEKLMVYLVGDKKVCQSAAKNMSHLDFVEVFDYAPSIVSKSKSQFMVLYLMDTIKNNKSSQISKKMIEINSLKNISAAVFVNSKELPCDVRMLFKECGVTETFSGQDAYNDLRAYITRYHAARKAEGTIEYRECEVAYYFSQDDLEKCLNIADEIMLTKDQHRYWQLLVDIFIVGKRFENALFYIDKIRSSDPYNMWASLKKAEISLLNNDVSTAIFILDKMDHFHSLSPYRLSLKGQIGLMGDDSELALQSYRAARNLDLDIEYEMGYYKALLCTGRIDDVFELYGREILDTDLIAFMQTRALMFKKLKRYKNSIDAYDVAITGCGSVANIMKSKLLYNQAIVFLLSDAKDRAIHALKKAQKLTGHKKAIEKLKELGE